VNSAAVDAGGTALFIISMTHEPDVARQTRRIVWFRDGQVIYPHLTPDQVNEVAIG
jgi:putative ABC transport system ATP-binding protein